MLSKEALLEIMRELESTGIKELIVAHDRVEMRTYERGGAESPAGKGLQPAAITAPAPRPGKTVAEEVPLRPEPEPARNCIEIRAPLPGTAYVAPGKDNNGKALPDEGDAVEEGTIIALVEAMKMFNEVFSPFKGVIRSIKAKNAGVVKVGDLLMVIEKSV